MIENKKIYIASDHAGLALKKTLTEKFDGLVDLGPSSDASVDYPDFAQKVSEQINDDSMGVLICGSGQGMVIKANRNPKVRAALCWTVEIAELARQHNNANVLCLPARFIETDLAVEIFNKFFSTEFEGGRHARRVEKLNS